MTPPDARETVTVSKEVSGMKRNSHFAFHGLCLTSLLVAVTKRDTYSGADTGG